MELAKRVKNFIKDNHISVSGIEGELGLPPQTISRADKQGIPEKHMPAILKHLGKFGFKA
jgi:hypothetical protein